jgi:hypothetical protein
MPSPRFSRQNDEDSWPGKSITLMDERTLASHQPGVAALPRQRNAYLTAWPTRAGYCSRAQPNFAEALRSLVQLLPMTAQGCTIFS